MSTHVKINDPTIILSEEQEHALLADERYKPTRAFDNFYGRRLFNYWLALNRRLKAITQKIHKIQDKLLKERKIHDHDMVMDLNLEERLAYRREMAEWAFEDAI